MATRCLWILLLLPVLVAGSAGAEEAPPRPADLDAVDGMVRARIDQVWQQVVEHPGDAAAWLELAQVYHAHELTDLAEICYREATRLAPRNPKAWYQLALAESDLGQPQAAAASLERVLTLTGDYAPAFWRLGRWWLEQGRIDDAGGAFEQATRVDPTDLAGWVGLARVLLARGQPQPAIEILFKVLSQDPANGVAGQLMGNAFRALGDHEAARRALTMGTGMGAYFPDPWQEEMLAQATGVGNRLRLLSAQLERGDIDRAVAELEALRAAHPRDVGVLNKLSEGYLHRRQAAEALAVLAVALEVDPAEFATFMHLAQAERIRGDLPAALAWADRAIEANPGHWQAYFERAGILGRMGRHEECLVAVEQAMGLGANQNPNAWLMQGDILLRLGDWPAAGRTFQQATLRFPFLGPAFLGLAVARAEQGRLDEARAALETARRMQQDPESLSAVQQRLDAVAARGE